jgi:translation initiation factor 2B subunit (eIF-2B alpha/beta/delta family)
MTDVISYRTEKGEKLKKLAKERDVSVSQLTNDIVNYYFEYFELRQKMGMFKGSSEMMSFCFSLISESDILKTTDFLSKVITRYVRTITNDFSLANLIKIILNYYDYNHFKFSEFDEPDYIKIVCKNSMPKNWNKYAALGLSKTFTDFGFAAAEDSSEDGIHSYKISKQKSH